jgi:hypothetical protein
MSRLLLAFLTFALVAPAAVNAQDREPQNVYWPLVTDGSEYRRVAYPLQAGNLVVMADTNIVLDLRAAEVAYWPITREYLTDASRVSQKLEGTFEIVGADGSVRSIEPEPFLLWHPEGVGLGNVLLVQGDRAAAVYESYVADARAAVEAQRTHQRIVAEHHAAVEAWLKLAAQRPAELPPPPPELTLAEPEPFRAFASEPEAGAIVNLPAGDYTVRMRGPDGSIVPMSERRLTAFAPLAEGTGYVIRPGDRWTQPAISFSPDETVYSTGRSDLYLQPVPVSEFKARDFSRLFRPQSVDVSDPYITIWVPRQAQDPESLTAAQLRLFGNGQIIGQVPAKAFRVAQESGRSRGYTIEEFQPVPGSSLAPDFSAMRIESGVNPSRIDLVGDVALPASLRTARTVAPVSEAWVFAAALVPILSGLLIQAGFRRRSRRRSSGPGGGGGGGAMRRDLALMVVNSGESDKRMPSTVGT